jgi:hypothetical protein
MSALSDAMLEQSKATNKGWHSMSDAILEQTKRISYEEGMRDALTYLAELYDGVEDTDLWADYMKEENN